MNDSIRSVVEEISELEDKCRAAIQFDSVVQAVRRKKEKVFEEICALLDFISDSEIALNSINTREKRHRIEPYFLAYGLLQLMYSRQISLKNILDTLDVPIPVILKNNSIIKARDRVIGHFTTSDGGAHVILRYSLNADGFEYASYYGAETRLGNFINYDTLIDEHLALMKESLTALYKALVKSENRRRRKMRKTPLYPAFQGINYIVRCLVCATVEEKYNGMVKSNVKMLKKSLITFQGGLVARRGEDQTAHYVDSVLEGTEMLLELHPFIDARSRLRFQIIADGIESNMNKLFAMAQQIDESECEELS